MCTKLEDCLSIHACIAVIVKPPLSGMHGHIDPICAIILWLHHSLLNGTRVWMSISCHVYRCMRRGMKGSSVWLFWFSEAPKLYWDCRKKLLNDGNGRRQLIVGFVEVSFSQLLPKVATACESVWMVYLFGSKPRSILHHGNLYCNVPSFAIVHSNPAAPFPSFAICHPC